MKIVEKRVDELIPYANNPRDNEKAVEAVASSIREFGFKVPVVIDRNDIIVAGHTRVLASKELGLEKVPCIVADDLSDEQIKAFRLADNKTAELAEWDFSKLDEELAALRDIDMTAFGFEDMHETFKSKMNNAEYQTEDDEYREFEEKFELKKTTDDCYTPDKVYEAVANWVEKEYNVSRRWFKRPFYPGGDYKSEIYRSHEVVVDNPPFSILSEILNFYAENNIKFFLFAPALTLFSSSSCSSCAIPVGVSVTYENGANVNTSFLTNLENEDVRLRTAPTLYKAVNEANKENLREQRKELPKYEFPDYVITSTRAGQFSRYGIDFKVLKSESIHIRALDAQKEKDKGIFGSAYLLSEAKKAEKEKAEKEKAEKEKAEKEKAEKEKAEKEKAEKWQLSEREKQLVKSLG